LYIASAQERFIFGVASCDWCWGAYTKVGDAVITHLGTNHNIVLTMADGNNDGNTYIKFGDNAHDGTLTVFNNSKVAVNGKLTAKEIEVKQDVWSDDVFSKDYKLMSLSELEKFINTHQHLPNVPTETEVKQNGVNVAEMNALLLRKIEELSKYVIDLKNENEQLAKRMEQIEKK
jgi:hypothetical protein